MKFSTSEYACKVKLLIKKDINRFFYGDYCPLNMQTWKDAHLMPFIEDVLSQLGFAKSGFLHSTCNVNFGRCEWIQKMWRKLHWQWNMDCMNG